MRSGNEDRAEERIRRIGMNEAVFREINDQLEQLFVEVGGARETLDLICECGHLDCADRIRFPRSSYEPLRGDPLRFAVVTGHELPEAEDVVERHPTFNIVRKRGPAAERVAAATDPRST